MTPSDADRQREIHQHDVLAWTVSFVLTLGLHVGIVLFILLTIALFAYALAATLARASSGIQAVTWFATVVSLTIWSVMVKQQARTFRPHAIQGIGRAIIATSGRGRGEIAADIVAALIGLAEIMPSVLSLPSGALLPELLKVPSVLMGALLLVTGLGSLVLRLRLRRRRLRDAG